MAAEALIHVLLERLATVALDKVQERLATVAGDKVPERLATVALDKVREEFKLVSGVEEEVKSLARNLEAIHAVLEDAEQRQVTEATVRHWLCKLTEVSYEIDDVLDEWITQVRKRQMEKEEKHALAIAEKVRSTASSFISGSKVRRFIHRREIAGRIKELNERLALIDKEKQRFHFQNTTRDPELLVRQKTTSVPNVKTFDRDNEKKLIVSKLLSESSEGNEVPLIIPIVGMGGMGKTTLAQLVYNDENVKSHFDKRIWVCVSDPFEEIKIAQSIIEGLDRDDTSKNSNQLQITSKNSNQLQILVECIYKLLEGKKFLLVLDDVWSPKLTQWEELIKALCNGAMGSRVLVTTRKEEVANLMKATTQMIPMRELGEAFCLSLFYYNADMNENNVSKEFHDIGLEIVKRCNGLPLAAKTLGSLMRYKKKIHEWRAVLRSKTWELKEIQQDVFRPLLLSYYDLTPATKRCLLYCVTFPKDYVYNKNNLIELWMSQDYLIGQNIFDDLVMRSFFQDVVVDDENGDMTCKIHDIVHDFLQYLTENECLILDFELDASERRDVSKDKVHHLTLVHATEGDSLKSFLRNYKKLRTLIAIQSSENSIGPIFELIVQLKCLRTLSLCGRRWGREGCLKEIPETIGGLIHLRYLDLSNNEGLKELPSALGSLYNLQTLRLVGCEILEKVDVGRLINLRHLYVEQCIELKLIKGIEKLTDLQRLDEFRVQFIGGDEGNKLEHLKDLNQLQGSLEIMICRYPNMAENAAIMVNKAHLLQLRLSFPWDSDEGESREIMNGLEPHPGLESLSIFGYGGGAFSHWLSSLHSLRVLTLEICRKCGVLPPLGKLASLESLLIQLLGRVSKVGVEFLGIDDGQTSSSSPIFISFPKLKQLTFRRMDFWEEWEGVENNNITIMPCLSQLTIEDCCRLKALPDFLWKTPLQKLHIKASPTLANLYRQGIGELRAKISHIPTIVIKD